MSRIIWTEDMDVVLVNCIERRDTIAVAADRIGVGNGTVRNRAKELGLRFVGRVAAPKPPKIDRQASEMAFCDLLAGGAPPQQAGDSLGYAHGNSVLQRIRSKLGWQAV